MVRLHLLQVLYGINIIFQTNDENLFSDSLPFPVFAH